MCAKLKMEFYNFNNRLYVSCYLQLTITLLKSFLGQTFQSEDCAPVWKINDELTDTPVIKSYYGRVDRNPIGATGEHWTILTLEHINFI